MRMRSNVRLKNIVFKIFSNALQRYFTDGLEHSGNRPNVLRLSASEIEHRVSCIRNAIFSDRVDVFLLSQK